MSDFVFTVLHCSQRESEYGEPYYDLNVVFKVNDPFYKGAVDPYTTLLVETTVIKDKEKWEHSCSDPLRQNNDLSVLTTRGYVIGEYFLDHLEKFDVYRCNITVKYHTATLGLIKYLNELTEIKNLDVNQFYDFIITLKSLNEFS
jgi:hypothetical protein